ncbi:DUF4139 domain-containing protein [Yinghuangia soli]|uniref:DUF4139 domain-containing protein n=1 Tax=Yinghuangia soli TaxID=2908204 RepID=A0AA41Q0X3_9ACTN|nr:DUF4139 domain-containing protein [Yinghuangia soli]MCF2529519.1 DUF4139 domain-containing protein [Yinghuangia soli]
MVVAVESDVSGRALESVLDAVVVYARGAVCTRRARFVLPAGHRGELRIRVGDVPLSASAPSLRGSIVSGPAGLRVADVRPRIEAVVVEAADLPRLRRIRDEAFEAAAKLTARRKRLAADIDTVAALRAVPAKPRREDPYPRPAAVEPVLALAAFVADRLDVLHGRLQALDEECRRADHEAQVAAHRLQEASGALRTEQSRTTGAAVLTLDLPDAVQDAADVVVDLEYQVPGACWVPMYQLRLDTAMTSGTLVMRAAVAQRTGEDWSAVRLALSTADLDRRTDLPELRSLRIGRRQAAPAPSGWREPPVGLDELFGGYDTAAAKRPPRYSGVALAAGAADSEDLYRTGTFAAVPAFGGPGGPPDGAYWQDEQRSPIPPPAPMMAMPPMPIAPGSAMPQPGGAPPPPPAQAAPAPRMARRRAAPGAAARAEAADTMAYGGAPPLAELSAGFAPEPDLGPPTPGADLLDYAGLVLAGPDEPAGRGKLRASGGADLAAEEYRRRAASVSYLPLPAHAVLVRTSAGSYDYRFEVAAPADVEADGAWHTVPVCTVEVGLEPQFVCVPSIDESVFGTVHVTNASPHALLAGPADVSVGGEFLTTVPLPTLAPGERQRVGVGVVESVQVARRTHMRESTAGLGNRTTVLDHRVEIDLANHLSREIAVEVLERVPVSDEKDVRIDEHAAEPAWAVDDELRDGRLVRGARVWRLRLPANSTRTLVGRYEIRIPAGKAVVGGNRRA